MSDFRFKPEKGYVARDTRVRPTCPFCGLAIERPKEPSVKRPGEMPVGSCSCGAVYAYDTTGHNLGAAFSEALVFACDMDWDLAWNLLPEEDYLENLVENYDLESNFIIPVGSYEGRRVNGALYFIRLHNDIQEVTRSGVQKKLTKTNPVKEKREKPRPSPPEKTLTKKDVEALVGDYQLEPILKSAPYDKRILRHLQRLLYSVDDLLLLRATDILGKVTGIMTKTDPGPVSNLIQRLLTSLTNADFGSSNWGAIDAIGEIVRNSPGTFAGYIPVLHQFLEEDESLQPKVLRALGRIAQAKPEYISKSFTYYLKYVQNNNPETRGHAVWLIGNLGKKSTRLGLSEAKAALERLREDEQTIGLYMDGHIETKTIGQLASEALQKLS